MVEKRLFDLFFSILFFFVFFPILLFVALYIAFVDKSSPFYVQERVGKSGKSFKLIKFRTMKRNCDEDVHITIGMQDPRITKTGYFLRKYKMDEMPQLINIILGHMSFVGPRPEVKNYVNLYTAEQKKVLLVKPGITSLASIAFINENEILGRTVNPEYTYIHKVMPAKLRLDLEYVNNHSNGKDLIIIFKTLKKIVRKK